MKLSISFILVACMVLSSLSLSGCGGRYGVAPVSLDARMEQLGKTALVNGRPSLKTELILRQRGLQSLWRKDIYQVYWAVKADYEDEGSRDLFFAMMELAYIGAKQQPKNSAEEARYLLTCLVHAHDFLFDSKLIPKPSPFEPSFGIARRFYDRALAELIVNRRERNLTPRANERLPMLDGSVQLDPPKSELAWNPTEFDKYFVSYEFKTFGLTEEYITQGVGVPLIAVRNVKEQDSRDVRNRFIPSIRQTFAATVFLRIKPADERPSPLPPVRQARLELYDPFKSFEIQEGWDDASQEDGRHLPLTSDLTTPLAYMMQVNSPSSGFVGLVRPEEWSESQGLIMFQPYEPNKIPVVFVHGLLSSPMTWLPMINTLMGDPELRKHYQFWFFRYPTGNPVLYSASLFRQYLQKAEATFDPNGTNPAFDKMVIVGHSMGGLLTRSTIQDSGDNIWNSLADIPFDTAELTPDERDQVKKMVYFKPLPFVSRVVFMAVPHRGATLADSAIGRIGSYLVMLPVTLLKQSFGVFYKIQAKVRPDEAGANYLEDEVSIPTGIDSLSPKNSTLIAGSELPLLVPYHSIIGNEDHADMPEGTDGVVPYSSSHLDGAVSERIFLSGHSVHTKPLAIREVRRILLEHAAKSIMQAGTP
ncbi:esterase/lipase family protein [Desulfovibrio inopinatus]|uniref:esterase/lipase family protein n=1 Tax=Desulfovibrio inopinatus TaxID=102109 RepID=UPI0003FBEA65|nr:alpha/beta fold hydrolase [Desulfovibrio inopinatus]